jgi:hypothetical protein
MANGKYYSRAIMFTDAELEGWFIYEGKSEMFAIDRHAVTWEGLTHNTNVIFFEKKLKNPEHQ